MHLLIIGGTGYIGSHVATAFAAAGHRVSVLCRPGGRGSAHRAVVGDVTDPSSLTAAAAGVDKVVVAVTPLGERAESAAVHALAGVPIIYTTGASVLGAGTSDETSTPDPHPISAGWPAVERRVLAAGGSVIRPGLVYGDGAGLVRDLFAAKAAERGTGVYIGPPGTRLPVVHVADLAELYVAVAERAEPSTIWHGMSETVRLDELAAAVGGGSAVSWPVVAATAELGPLADLFTRDQDVSSKITQRALGWAPLHTSMLAEVRISPPGRC